MTEWFLLHDNPPQLWEPLHITHRVEGDDIVWSIPVTGSFEVLPLPVPKEGRWHRCQNRKRLPLHLRPAKKRAMIRRFRQSVNAFLVEVGDE